MHGIVTDIQRFSVHDGPGIRTTVFLKGCQLRCRWCHNPETLRGQPELQLFLEKCIGCGACFAVCPHGAHVPGAAGSASGATGRLLPVHDRSETGSAGTGSELRPGARAPGGEREFRRELCAACGACAAGCYAEGLVLVGREMTAPEVLAEVREDRAFYESSGGGVTLSGGEPLCQAEFARAILALCRDAGLATALETNLAWPWERVAEVLEATDLVLADLKLMDDAAHRRWTGAGNQQVLDNLRRLAATGVPLIVRTPVVPGVNDRREEIGAIAAFLAELPGLLYYELLPYHPLAAGKYQSLGMEEEALRLTPPSAATMRELAAAAWPHGVTVRVAGQRA